MYKVFSFGKMTYGSNTSNSLAAKQILVGMVPELYLKKHNFFHKGYILSEFRWKKRNKLCDYIASFDRENNLIL